MQRERLVSGLAVAFAGMTVTMMLVSVVFRSVFVFVASLPMAAATYLFWYQASGKFRERVTEARTRTHRERGGFGADPRGGSTPSGDRDSPGSGRRQPRSERRRNSPEISPVEAYRRLGLDPDADEDAVRRAYRRKIKEVHPDRGGSTAEFRRVTEAYETLTE